MDSSDALDDKDSGPEVQINIPSSVMSRIEELMGGTEQFDSEEFDPVAYINKIFPTEQSLSGVESAAARCEFRLQGVEQDIMRLVRAQAAQRQAGQRALLEAQTCIAELALQVADINKKAERSESMVREITSEIKQLDCAKWNLTSAITALNHLHMLSGGVDQLSSMTKNRQYKEIALPMQAIMEIKQLDCAKWNLTSAITALNHLHMLSGGVDQLSSMTKNRQYKEIALPMQAIMEVLQHFALYQDIREVSQLRDRVRTIREELTQQILDDFKQAFTAGSKSVTVSHRQLAEACGVVDILEPKVKEDLLKWFINMQLQEYLHLFSSEQECAWLSHVERRYAWLKRHLLTFEQSVANIFPIQWGLSQMIAQAFCEMTRDELSKIMASRRNEIDVKLLLYAIQKTYNFELLLHKRFVGTDIGTEIQLTPSEKDAFDVDAKDSNSEPALAQSASPWAGLVGACFEPHLSLYINSLDSNLRQLLDTFIQDAKSTGAATSSEIGAGAVISSCADLFLLYKKCLVQCSRLTRGEPMLELAGVFQKYLREYASSVLQRALPCPTSGLTLSLTASNMPSLVSNLHTLLNEGHTETRYTKQEISKITSVITTSEYCLETTVHLEQKLKEKVLPTLAEKIDLTPEQDLFHKMISNCIQMLVQDLELSCEPALQAMSKISWLNFDNVGDQSSYVTQIIMHLKNTVPNLRDYLSSSRKYFTQFCIRFANSFIPKFIQNIYKCKPISTVGSEQLLLDTHMLKTALLELPSIGSQVKRPAPATYTKVVIKLMTKAEMILKLVMAPLDGDAELFVAQFVQLLPECSIAEFHKVIDMKGVKLSKAQMAVLDAKFKEKTKG